MAFQINGVDIKVSDSEKLDGIDSAGFVKTSGNETIAGIKTFSSQPAISAAQGSGANDVLKYGTINTANSAPVKTALNAGGSAPIYACRAWVNFNGTGTVAIRASGNVSSITDLSTGEYRINFTTEMPDVNYSPYLAGNNSSATTSGCIISPLTLLTSSLQIKSKSEQGSSRDMLNASVGIFR